VGLEKQLTHDHSLTHREGTPARTEYDSSKHRDGM